MTLDPRTAKVTLDSRPVRLTGHEYRVLAYLMHHHLLDNACKWARSTVRVQSEARDGAVAVSVDDDGPGLAPELRIEVLRRGVRADEQSPGSGLGLAIVRDLAGLYGGAIALEQSPGGGVRAVLRLPAYTSPGSLG